LRLRLRLAIAAIAVVFALSYKDPAVHGGAPPPAGPDICAHGVMQTPLVDCIQEFAI